jgi:transposase-like protein
MVISIRGGKYWLWRAVDNEGEVLDSSSSTDGMPKPQRNSW